MKKNDFWNILYAFSIILLLPTMTHGAGFTVTPMLQEITLDDGEVMTQQIIIK